MFTLYAIDDKGRKCGEIECETLADVESCLATLVHETGLDAPEFEADELPEAHEAYMAGVRYGLSFNGNDAIPLYCALSVALSETRDAMSAAACERG